MKRPTLSLALLTIVLAVGCRTAGGVRSEFIEACLETSNLDPAVCECMAAKAEEELSDDEREFVLASLQEDETRTAELRQRLGVQGAMRAGLFMTEVADCAVRANE